MYIEPYWAGVFSVLFIEFAAFFLCGMIGSMKKKKKQ